MTKSDNIRDVALDLVVQFGSTLQSIESISLFLKIHPNTLSLWWKQYLSDGTRSAKRTRTSRELPLDVSQDIEYAKALLDVEPSLTVNELCDAIFATYGRAYSEEQIKHRLECEGYSKKKLQYIAWQRNEPLRQQWRELVCDNWLLFPSHQYVFIDETHLDHDDTVKRTGWSLRGRRAWVRRRLTPRQQDEAPGAGNRRACSAIVAMSIEGILSVTTSETVNSEVFMEALRTDVLPKMNTGGGVRSILVMDNASVHDKLAVMVLCGEFGVEVLWLPPYSYDYNPVELAHHCAKLYIRTNWNGSEEYPVAYQLHEAFFSCITPTMACNFFEKSGMYVQDFERAWANRNQQQ